MITPRWRKVLHDLFDNKTRLILIVLSIAVGVIAFGGLFTARSVLLTNLNGQFVEGNPVDITITLAPFDDALLDWVSHHELVEHAQGVTVYTAQVVGEDGRLQDAQIVAYDNYEEQTINLVRGENGMFPPERGQVLLERSYLRYVNWQPGDRVTLQINNDAGERYELRFGGTVYDIHTESGNMNTLLKLYVMRRTLTTLGLSTHYNSLYLDVDRDALSARGMTLDDVAEDLRAQLEARGIVVGGMSIQETLEHWANDTLSGLSLVLVVVGVVSLLLSGFLIVNTISGLMAQQRRYIGIMKIIGASREQITTLYLVMVAGYGLMAVLLAIPLSIGLARGVSTGLSQLINFDIALFEVPPLIIFLMIVSALLAPLVSALMPILGGTRLPPAQAISDYNASSITNPIDVALSKIRGLPRPLLLSLRNVFRRKTRLVITLITLILAGAFFLAIMNVRDAVPRQIQSFLRMLDSDIFIIFRGSYDVQGIALRALETEGVTAVEVWNSATTSVVFEDGELSQAYVLQGLPALSRFIDPEMLSGRWLSLRSNANRYDLVVTDELLKDEPSLTVGSTVTLRTNGADQVWNIIGIVDTDAIGGEIDLYTHSDTVADVLGQVDQGSWLLVETEDATPATQTAVAARLTERFDAVDMNILRTQTQSEITGNALAAFGSVIVLLLVTAMLIALVGGLGLAGTMSLSVLERTREIGVMRSIGAGTNTLRGMFIAEGVIIGLISFVLALVLSVPASTGFANALGTAMFGRPMAVSLNLTGPLLWLVIIIIVSAIASVAPAQRASQISIREALSYE